MHLLPLGLDLMIPFNSEYSMVCDSASTSRPTVAVFSGAFGTKAAAGAAYIIPCI